MLGDRCKGHSSKGRSRSTLAHGGKSAGDVSRRFQQSLKRQRHKSQKFAAKWMQSGIRLKLVASTKAGSSKMPLVMAETC